MLQLQHRSQLWLGSDPCLGTPYATRQTKKKTKTNSNSRHGAAETNPTRNHEVSGSIPGLDLWVKVPALLWLWCRPVATTPIRPLAWEPPCAEGVALKRQKKTKTKRKLLPPKGSSGHWRTRAVPCLAPLPTSWLLPPQPGVARWVCCPGSSSDCHLTCTLLSDITIGNAATVPPSFGAGGLQTKERLPAVLPAGPPVAPVEG